ncbi:hypothetical protein ES288_D10G067600v1 [Gossypium darwinii]|uniref:RNase III domain-containing protein n=2 Tax=Gossypium TaxID=3633 RepID=A0A5D2J0L0_GOSTO|nr:hypothetical protein ES288_D10G067600v1 [Gossypium darwinii]TYH48478.1 hypothetical protein ES332_D10G069200v1 [Gossypium tomentosum]
MAILTWTPPSPVAVTASWDTQQRPSYNPNAPRKLKPTPNLKPSPPITLPTRTDPSVFDILKRPTQEVTPVKVDLDDTYLGYERWLPTPPKVEKPRSVFNAATLAYIGDCIYELYARRHFLYPPLNIEEYNDRVTSVVRCEAQDALLQELLNVSFLSNTERDVLRWGKNINSAKTRTKKRAGVAVYNRASSLETLIGYLYLTNVNRLEKLMVRLGFSTGASAEMIPKEINGAKPVQ